MKEIPFYRGRIGIIPIRNLYILQVCITAFGVSDIFPHETCAGLGKAWQSEATQSQLS